MRTECACIMFQRTQVFSVCYNMYMFKDSIAYVCVFQAIPMTPIRVKVDPAHDASKVKAEGPGLSRSGKKTIQCEIFPCFYLAINYSWGKQFSGNSSSPPSHQITVVLAMEFREIEIHLYEIIT